MKKYRTLLAGFGQIATGYGDDPRYVEHVSCPTHADALTRHPGFDWLAVADPQPSALDIASSRWGVTHVASLVENLSCAEDIEVAVLATPPEARLEIIQALPRLKAVFVEKPLASDLSLAREFLEVCAKRDILVQVNITRRGDASLQDLANGGLADTIGIPRAVFGVYGNGVSNMATHGVDMVRMFFGEVQTVQALPGGVQFEGGPLPGDINVPFVLTLDEGLQSVFMPLQFEEYREAGLDIWGSLGRLQLVQEGLVLLHSPVKPCRSFTGVNEIGSDAPEVQGTGYGEALYQMYDNLYQCLRGRSSRLLCPGGEALATMRVVEAVKESARSGGAVVHTPVEVEDPQTIYFAHDPGAAELVGHLFAKESSEGAVLLGQGYAPDVYRKLGLGFTEFASIEPVLEWLETHQHTVNLLVSGTSQSIDADCLLWRKAKSLGIPVRVHVDHWMHPVERFKHLGELLLPDEVHVVDEYSRDALVEAGAVFDSVIIAGQPVVEAKAQAVADLRIDPSVRQAVLRTIQQDEGVTLHVFISENITELGLKSTFGFDELDSFLAYRESLAGKPVIVKIHPKESEDKWQAFFSREGIRDCRIVSSQVSPEELISVADSVGGLFSILLLQAHLAGIPVVSCQPGLKVQNPMDSSFVDGVRTILTGPSKKE